MMAATAKLKTCTQGHRFYKSSDCPVCPFCEKPNAIAHSFMLAVSAPARRALERAGITNLRQLAAYSEKELLQQHGIGPSAIPKLKHELKKENLQFKTS